MPSKLEVTVWTDEKVVKFHHKLILAATSKKLLYSRYDFVGKVGLCKQFVTRQ